MPDQLVKAYDMPSACIHSPTNHNQSTVVAAIGINLDIDQSDIDDL